MKEKAFPSPESFSSPGMDLRDYFAAKAMQGLLINNEAIDALKQTGESIPEIAYAMADNMLKEREK